MHFPLRTQLAGILMIYNSVHILVIYSSTFLLDYEDNSMNIKHSKC